MTAKFIHKFSFLIGIYLFVFSLFESFIFPTGHFYTSFAIGSWLILDFIDYQLTKNSILGYFVQHRHRKAILLFLSISTLFCFIVDYLWGVKVAGMWIWLNYEPIHFVRMYIFMNGSFVLGMYELFRIVKHIIKEKYKISDRALLFSKYKRGFSAQFYVYSLLLGLLFLIAPGYALIFDTTHLIEYVMVLPFVSMILISDSITYLTGGKPVLDNILKLKESDFLTLIITSAVGSILTEFINLFGKEWQYSKMPFHFLQISGIPIAVFIGWIPLVVGSIAIVNLVKHLDYLIEK